MRATESIQAPSAPERSAVDFPPLLLTPTPPEPIKIVLGDSNAIIEEKKRIAALPKPKPKPAIKKVVATTKPNTNSADFSINEGMITKGAGPQCVIYVKSKTGYSEPVGAARNWPIKKGLGPVVGAVVVTAESSLGHVAIVADIKDGYLILDESNYKTGRITYGRKLPIGSPLIKGYYKYGG